jgi:hypothetical protein
MRAPPELSAAFEATVILSLVGGVLGAAASAHGARRRARRDAPRAAPRERVKASARAVAVLAHPLAQLVFVCVLVYLNQVAFDAYVLTAHGGSAAFAQRFVGPGWFAIARTDPVVGFVAARVRDAAGAGDGSWLSFTLFRVQAFLELPFTLFAYLAVARMLGRGVHRTLARAPLVALASASFTVTFSLVELLLRNPWTNDDLLLRALSAIVTPCWVVAASRLEDRAPPRSGDRRPSGVLGLAVFLAGAGAIAFIVLALYDAFLLYNLAHLPRYAVGLAIAVPVAALASRSRRGSIAPSPAGSGARRRAPRRSTRSPRRSRRSPSCSSYRRSRFDTGVGTRQRTRRARSSSPAPRGRASSAPRGGRSGASASSSSWRSAPAWRSRASRRPLRSLRAPLSRSWRSRGGPSRSSRRRSSPRAPSRSFSAASVLYPRRSMKRKPKLTKREKKALSPRPAQPERAQAGHGHIHCIACGRHLAESDFEAPATATTITCEHGSTFPTCVKCMTQSMALVAEHDKTNQPVKVAPAFH